MRHARAIMYLESSAALHHFRRLVMKLNIGENIKHLRREKDMTQEEFAEILGVSCQSVSR